MSGVIHSGFINRLPVLKKKLEVFKMAEDISSLVFHPFLANRISVNIHQIEDLKFYRILATYNIEYSTVYS